MMSLTWILLFILPLPIHGTLSIMKQYTLLNAANFTWNDAKLKCEAIGGSLAKIETEAELSTIQYLDQQAPWNSSLSNGEYWFGLHIRGDNDGCSTKTNYFWSDCEPLFQWTNWAQGEPNDCNTDQCIRMANLKFRTFNCKRKFGALCEKEQGSDSAGECTFEEIYIERVVGLSHKKVTLNVPATSCRSACLNYIIDEGTQCWFYQTIQKEFDVNMTVIAENSVCFLFFTTNTYTVDTLSPLGNWTNATTIYVKRCFEAILDEENQPDSLDAWAEVREPNTTCPVIGDCYFETIGVLDLDRAKDLVHTTLEVPGTEQECKDMCMGSVFHKDCWFVDTFSPLSKACRLYYLHSDLPDTFTVLDPKRRKRTLFMKKCLKEEMTTTAVPTTTTTPELVFEELRVEVQGTGNYRRKFISIYEDRLSAMSMGIIGAVFIAFIICFMVLSDIPIFYKHARTIGAKNIRTRNRCFPPRKKTKKTKSSVTNPDKTEPI